MAEDEEQKLIQFPCGQDHWTHSEWEVMRNSIKKKDVQIVVECHVTYDEFAADMYLVTTTRLNLDWFSELL